MKNLETERMILRKFVETDAEKAYENWAGIKEIADMADFSVHACVDETKKIIQMGLGDENTDAFTWALISKETNEPIGFVRLYEIWKENKTCKLAWAIGEKWWNQNYSTEAIKEVADYVLNEEGFNVVSCIYYSSMDKINGPILEKATFEREAVLKSRRIDRKSGVKLDKIIYARFANSMK